MWSDRVISLANRVAGELQTGAYSEELFESLCKEIQGDEPPESFGHFPVFVEDVASPCFCDSELSAILGVEPPQITDGQRLQYMRELLEERIEKPMGDEPSAHWEEIAVSPHQSLYCCALVHIEGYTPVTSWWGAFLSLDEFYKSLAKSGYVTCKQDVAQFSDEFLMRQWTNNATA